MSTLTQAWLILGFAVMCLVAAVVVLVIDVREHRRIARLLAMRDTPRVP